MKLFLPLQPTVLSLAGNLPDQSNHRHLPTWSPWSDLKNKQIKNKQKDVVIIHICIKYNPDDNKVGVLRKCE